MIKNYRKSIPAFIIYQKKNNNNKSIKNYQLFNIFSDFFYFRIK